RAGIDDEQVVVLANAVNDDIVHERPLRIQQRRVVRLADLQLRRVIHADVIHGVERLLADDKDVAHVADVENSDAGAHGHVFGDEAGVFDRHVPSAEVDHLGAEAAVYGVERGLAQGGSGSFLNGGHGVRSVRRVARNQLVYTNRTRGVGAQDLPI